MSLFGNIIFSNKFNSSSKLKLFSYFISIMLIKSLIDFLFKIFVLLSSIVLKSSNWSISTLMNWISLDKVLIFFLISSNAIWNSSLILKELSSFNELFFNNFSIWENKDWFLTRFLEIILIWVELLLISSWNLFSWFFFLDKLYLDFDSLYKKNTP